MPKQSSPQPRTAPLQPTAASARRDRQKAALKENMARRKAQAQALAECGTAADTATQTDGTGADTGTDLDKSKD